MEVTEETNGREPFHHGQQIPPNPPSVEAAYKRKCIELKKRLNEIETHNDELRLRNVRGARYIQKMRLESCMLLERLATLTGEDEGKVPRERNPELRANAMTLMDESGSYLGDSYGGSHLNNNHAADSRRDTVGQSYLDDASDGSTDGHPPTPQERPLRPKRSRKLDDESGANHGPSGNNNGEPVSSTLPILMPAVGSHAPSAGYDPSGPVSNLNVHPSVAGSSRTAPIAPRGGGVGVGGAGAGSLANSPLRHHQSGVDSTSPFTPIAAASGGHGQSPHHSPPTSHRYHAAFEDFANRNKDKVMRELVDTYGAHAGVSDQEVHHALTQQWHSMDPDEKRQYGNHTAGRENGV